MDPAVLFIYYKAKSSICASGHVCVGRRMSDEKGQGWERIIIPASLHNLRSGFCLKDAASADGDTICASVYFGFYL